MNFGEGEGSEILLLELAGWGKVWRIGLGLENVVYD